MARPIYSILRKIRHVLIHCIGDTRVCPKCQHSFIPSDATQQETIELYKTIFGEFRKKKRSAVLYEVQK